MCVALVTVHYWCPKITGVLLRDNPERLQFWSRPRMSAPASMSCHNPPLKPNSGPAYDGGGTCPTRQPRSTFGRLSSPKREDSCEVKGRPQNQRCAHRRREPPAPAGRPFRGHHRT